MDALSSLDWCKCGHIRWWHSEGKCLSCSKTMILKDAEAVCAFTLKGESRG